MASMTHKDRVSAFNAKLESLRCVFRVREDQLTDCLAVSTMIYPRYVNRFWSRLETGLTT